MFFMNYTPRFMSKKMWNSKIKTKANTKRLTWIKYRECGRWSLSHGIMYSNIMAHKYGENKSKINFNDQTQKYKKQIDKIKEYKRNTRTQAEQGDQRNTSNILPQTSADQKPKEQKRSWGSCDTKKKLLSGSIIINGKQISLAKLNDLSIVVLIVTMNYRTNIIINKYSCLERKTIKIMSWKIKDLNRCKRNLNKKN